MRRRPPAAALPPLRPCRPAHPATLILAVEDQTDGLSTGPRRTEARQAAARRHRLGSHAERLARGVEPDEHAAGLGARPVLARRYARHPVTHLPLSCSTCTRKDLSSATATPHRVNLAAPLRAREWPRCHSAPSTGRPP